MKILITEKQLRLISEQVTTLGDENPNKNIYTDEKEYKKALNNYNKSMKIYMNFKQAEQVRKEYDDAIKKKYPDIKWKENRFKTASSIKDDKWEPIISFGSVTKIPSTDTPSGFFIKYEEDLTIPEWNSKHKNDPINPLYFVGGGGHYRPVYEKPIKPIFKKIETKPIEKPIEKPIINTTTVNTTLTNTDVKQPTSFSVTWREDLPTGKVEQNTHYFPNYEEWAKFTNQFDKYISKNENNSKTNAEALYSQKLNLSKDKTF